MKSSALIPAKRVARSILVVRGRQVILDTDLAALYRVETGQLVRAVKRNAVRLPANYCFQLTDEEGADLRYQFGTSSSAAGGSHYPPYAFSEHGVIAAAFVLDSAAAVQVSVQVVEVFVRIRQILASNEDLARKVAALDRRSTVRDSELHRLSAAFERLLEPASMRPPRPRIELVQDNGGGQTEQPRRRPRSLTPRSRQ